MNETDLFKEDREQLDEEWHGAFDTLTGQGNAPSSIRAAIEYVSTHKTQEQVAEEYNVSKPTVRNLQEAVVALGPLDNRVGETKGSGKMTKLEYATHVADRLGWEEGIEYSVNRNVYGSPHVSLRKEGFEDLYQKFTDD